MRAALIWLGLAIFIGVPAALALSSPLLQWRQPVYVVAGFAGVVGLAFLLLQPLLIGGYLPGLAARRGRLVHRFVGVALLLAVVIHVGGLWLTSPPDVVDALLFNSATPFSAWGVIAMWAVFAAALVAALRNLPSVNLRIWRIVHSGLAVVIVICTAVHAILIQGTMEPVTKAILAIAVLIALGRVIYERRIWALFKRTR